MEEQNPNSGSLTAIKLLPSEILNDLNEAHREASAKAKTLNGLRISIEKLAKRGNLREDEKKALEDCKVKFVTTLNEFENLTKKVQLLMGLTVNDSSSSLLNDFGLVEGAKGGGGSEDKSRKAEGKLEALKNDPPATLEKSRSDFNPDFDQSRGAPYVVNDILMNVTRRVLGGDSESGLRLRGTPGGLPDSPFETRTGDTPASLRSGHRASWGPKGLPGPFADHRPEDKLPKVIVCQPGGPSRIPQIIVCEPTRQSRNGIAIFHQFAGRAL